MIHRVFTKTTIYSAAAIAALALFVCSGVTAYGDSAKVSNLLQQARSSAAQLRRDAVQMEAYTRSKVSWQSHATQIETIKKHVNDSAQVVDNLHSARDGAEPWQQDAIDRITPLLQEMTHNTTAIIDHLNDRSQTWKPEYQSLLRSNAELATDLHKLIGDYIDYDSAKAKFESLGKKAGVSPQE